MDLEDEARCAEKQAELANGNTLQPRRDTFVSKKEGAIRIQATENFVTQPRLTPESRIIGDGNNNLPYLNLDLSEPFQLTNA